MTAKWPGLAIALILIFCLPSVVLAETGWLSGPVGGRNSVVQCPAPSQWTLLYWSGSPTPVSEAVKACASMGKVWANQSGRWVGFSADAIQASEQWTVETGEADFVSGSGATVSIPASSSDVGSAYRAASTPVRLRLLSDGHAYDALVKAPNPTDAGWEPAVRQSIATLRSSVLDIYKLNAPACMGQSQNDLVKAGQAFSASMDSLELGFTFAKGGDTSRLWTHIYSAGTESKLALQLMGYSQQGAQDARC